MKSAFLESPYDFVATGKVVTDYLKLTKFMEFLVRYYVPTRLHFLIWERYTNNLDTTEEARIVSTYMDMTSSGGNNQRAIIEAVQIMDTIFRSLEPLVEPGRGAIYYPVNKLVGFRLSNLLKRCGIVTLLYPYPLESSELQSLRASVQGRMYKVGTFVNIGTRSLKKLASKVENGDEADALLDKGKKPLQIIQPQQQ